MPMQMGFRWYGEGNDNIKLSDIKQIPGVTTIVWALHHKLPGEIWEEAEIAEVKVTLNQSAVPEGMVFDLWAIDEASLLGNPAVAYNEESFTIPAGSPPRKLRQLLPLPEHRRTRSRISSSEQR